MTSRLGSRWVCAGCGAALDPDHPLPFTCPRAPGGAIQAGIGDDVDHVLQCELDLDDCALPAAGSDNPFVRFRGLTHSWRFARRLGMSDHAYIDLVDELDRSVSKVTGRPRPAFAITPYAYAPTLDVCIKDETGQVAGSHKSRHLMGVAIHLAVVEALGLVDIRDRRLAAFSCGNAALAAAVVAKAAGRPLVVFVPTWASSTVLERMSALGADIEVCERNPSDPPGDPTHHAFRRAVRSGCIPFTCQGSECALTIEGGRLLGYEIARQHLDAKRPALGSLFLQVGGGAFASSVIQGLRVATVIERSLSMPRIHAVQGARVQPLVRAWQRLVSADAGAAEPMGQLMAHARSHRSDYMWPWETPKSCVATGILDDETHDWLVIVHAILETHGSALAITEDTLMEAHERAREAATTAPASPTGTAGLAGVLAWRADRPPRGEPTGQAADTAVVFTGVR